MDDFFRKLCVKKERAEKDANGQPTDENDFGPTCPIQFRYNEPAPGSEELKAMIGMIIILTKKVETFPKNLAIAPEEN